MILVIKSAHFSLFMISVSDIFSYFCNQKNLNFSKIFKAIGLNPFSNRPNKCVLLGCARLEKSWEKLRMNKQLQKWYYTSVYEICIQGQDKNHPIFQRY